VPPILKVLFGAIPPFAVSEAKLELPPLFADVVTLPCPALG
jgi:hypothetical protein